MTNTETKLCPFCREEVKATAIKCKHCGSMFSDEMNTHTQLNTDPKTIIRHALAGKYELLDELGKGGMATVYKARQKNLDRIVALKVIHQNLVHDEEFVNRFLQEAKISSTLNHNNIVTVYDIDSEGMVHYLALEYLESNPDAGENLHSWIKQKGALSTAQLFQILFPILNALDYVHSLNLIHRDVKSSNIMITKSGRSVLMDFGIVKAADGTSLTEKGAVLGTPEYMSPEQALSEKLTNRSDLWSMGVVMYQCLTGKLPFQADSPLSVIHKVVNDTPVPPNQINKNIPHWLNSIVLKMLEKDPAKRFKNGQEIIDAINRKQDVGTGNQSSYKRNAGRSEGIKKTPANILPVAIGAIAVLMIVAAVWLLIPKNPQQNEVTEVESIIPNRPQPAENDVTPVPQKPQPQPVEEEVVNPPTVTPQNITGQNPFSKYNMVKINGGIFQMGNPDGGTDAQPIHNVKINDFYLGKYEVTQQQWQEIMGGNPFFFEGTDKPVERVSWKEVRQFISKLNQKTGKRFRLPTEAEWEYAAHGGSSSNNQIFSGGHNAENVAWFDGNSGRETHTVGTRAGNGYGLHDMSGNVFEWCSDWYAPDFYKNSPGENPSGPATGSEKVVRGGSFDMNSGFCKVYYRHSMNPNQSHYNLGFRLAHD